ncbi:MAG TPA: alginate export family protein [Pirellulales bacterium]|nr:alginate export family protein [Pirellulales bacterium]
MGEPVTEGPAMPIEPEQMMGQEPASEVESADWTKNSNARIFPRLGNFFILPRGPGYYSLMDQVHGIRREAPPQSAYPAFAIMSPGFFDADFRYLDKKDDKDKQWFERLKRIRLGENFMFSTGGETWYRYNDLNNLTPGSNTYGLTKVRTYGDLWYRDQFRVYAEFIDADRGGGTQPPAPTDIDRADFLNLFVDVKVADIAEHPVYVRGGRQEVLLGSQRLVSNLAWANMRRNFDGVRGFRQGDKFDVDLFWLEPVIPNATQFDKSDHNQQLAGSWFTYRKKKGHFLDFYYLYYNNSNTVVRQGIVSDPTRVNTFGTRYAGDRNNYLWDFEYALQLGQRGSHDLVAGMATTGLGYHLAKRRWNPTLWLYYDFASGSANPNAGRYATFNQLFPFGHYYLGWADAVGRQNIQDVNLHLGIYPVPWTTLWLQYHHFWLNQPRDALYNAAGAAVRRDPSGAAGTNVGDEIDLVANFHVNAQSDFMVVYAQLFGGGFLQATSSPSKSSSQEAVYAMYNFRW